MRHNGNGFGDRFVRGVASHGSITTDLKSKFLGVTLFWVNQESLSLYKVLPTIFPQLLATKVTYLGPAIIYVQPLTLQWDIFMHKVHI